MYLVDTSVWIDFLRGTENPVTQQLTDWLENESDLFSTGIILQEMLNGIPNPKQQKNVHSLLKPVIWIMPTIQTHIDAANIFSGCRTKGFQIRNSVDCLIAALAIEYNLPLLHKDRDYDFISKVFPLKII